MLVVLRSEERRAVDLADQRVEPLFEVVDVKGYFLSQLVDLFLYNLQ